MQFLKYTWHPHFVFLPLLPCFSLLFPGWNWNLVAGMCSAHLYRVVQCRVCRRVWRLWSLFSDLGYKSVIWANGIVDVIQSDDSQWPLQFCLILSICMALRPQKFKFRAGISNFMYKFGTHLLTMGGGGDWVVSCCLLLISTTRGMSMYCV